MFSLVPAPGQASFCQHLLQRRGPSAVCGDFSLKKVVGVRRRSSFPKRAALATAVRKRAHNASAALLTLCGLSFLWQPVAILLAKGFRRQDKVRFVPTHFLPSAGTKPYACFFSLAWRTCSHCPLGRKRPRDGPGAPPTFCGSALRKPAGVLFASASRAGWACPPIARLAWRVRSVFCADVFVEDLFMVQTRAEGGEAVRARPFCGFAAEVWSGRLFGRCFPAAGSRAPLGGLSPPLCLRGGSCLFGSTGRRCEPRTSCRFFCEGRRHVHSAAAPLPQGGIAPPFWPLTRYRPLQVGIF